MNEHILLVMKWLKNPESVSQEELKANCKSAAYYAAYADDAYESAQHWVDIYFKRSGENKADYENALAEVELVDSTNDIKFSDVGVWVGIVTVFVIGLILC